MLRQKGKEKHTLFLLDDSLLFSRQIRMCVIENPAHDFKPTWRRTDLHLTVLKSSYCVKKNKININVTLFFFSSNA